MREQLQGCYSVLFCPFFLIRTFKTQNVLLCPYKDTHVSFYRKLHFLIRNTSLFFRKLRPFLIILTRSQHFKIIWNVFSRLQHKKVRWIFILVPSYKGQGVFRIHPQCRGEYLKLTSSNALQVVWGNLALVKKPMPYLRCKSSVMKFDCHPQVRSIFERCISHPTSFQLEISALSGLEQIIFWKVDKLILEKVEWMIFRHKIDFLIFGLWLSWLQRNGNWKFWQLDRHN